MFFNVFAPQKHFQATEHLCSAGSHATAVNIRNPNRDTGFTRVPGALVFFFFLSFELYTLTRH